MVDIVDFKVVDCSELTKLELADSVETIILEVEVEVEVTLKLIIEVEKILGRVYEL